jgi:hypothetical protein
MCRFKGSRAVEGNPEEEEDEAWNPFFAMGGFDNEQPDSVSEDIEFWSRTRTEQSPTDGPRERILHHRVRLILLTNVNCETT